MDKRLIFVSSSASNHLMPLLLCVCVSDLNSNRLQRIQGLAFQGLSNVVSLRLQRNLLTDLMDGAFYGLTSIQNMYVTQIAVCILLKHCIVLCSKLLKYN